MMRALGSSAIRPARRIGFIAGCLIALASTLLPAAQLDQQAEKVLRHMADYYGKAASFGGTMRFTAQISSRETSDSLDTTYEIALQRPDKFALRLTGGENGSTIIADGSRLVTHVGRANKYTVTTGTTPLADLKLDPATNPAVMLGVLIPVSAFFKADAWAALTNDITSGTYAGMSSIAGKPAHHLRLALSRTDWDFWIADGEKPELLRFKPDVSRGIAELAKMRGEEPPKFDVLAEFSDWRVGEALPSGSFDFAPPPGAEQLDSFFPESPGESKAREMIGKPAPAFSLDLLEGGKLNLADLRGKIVILDFWATWCPPCRAGLPILEKIAKQYADRDVVFYAVNIREEADAIRKFLEQNGHAFPVALDKDAKVSDDFLVQPIPHTVVIDKQGNVADVHIGLSDGEELTVLLDKLTATK